MGRGVERVVGGGVRSRLGAWREGRGGVSGRWWAREGGEIGGWTGTVEKVAAWTPVGEEGRRAGKEEQQREWRRQDSVA